MESAPPKYKCDQTCCVQCCVPTNTDPNAPIFEDCGVRTLEFPSTKFYFPISALRPCQTSYSCLNVKDKRKKAIKKGYAVWDGEKFVLSYNGGKALYPKSKAFPIISSPYGYILLNGTHRTIASMSMGAETVPVFIKHDFSTLSKKKFDKMAVGKYVFPYDLCGELTYALQCKFSDLIDAANRYFAIISARNCKDIGTPVEETTGYDYPLWIRIGTEHTAAFEWMISQTLYSHGLVYKNEYGKNIPTWFVEAARQILKDNPIPNLCLIEQRTLYSEIPGICSYCV